MELACHAFMIANVLLSLRLESLNLVRDVVEVDRNRILIVHLYTFDSDLRVLLFPRLPLFQIDDSHLINAALLLWLVNLGRDYLIQAQYLLLLLTIFLHLNSDLNWLEKFRR